MPGAAGSTATGKLDAAGKVEPADQDAPRAGERRGGRHAETAAPRSARPARPLARQWPLRRAGRSCICHHRASRRRGRRPRSTVRLVGSSRPAGAFVRRRGRRTPAAALCHRVRGRRSSPAGRCHRAAPRRRIPAGRPSSSSRGSARHGSVRARSPCHRPGRGCGPDSGSRRTMRPSGPDHAAASGSPAAVALPGQPLRSMTAGSSPTDRIVTARRAELPHAAPNDRYAFMRRVYPRDVGAVRRGPMYDIVLLWTTAA